jgi:hypothetical protein
MVVRSVTSERESGSGGRTRTYDQAVNSRPMHARIVIESVMQSVTDPIRIVDDAGPAWRIPRRPTTPREPVRVREARAQWGRDRRHPDRLVRRLSWLAFRDAYTGRDRMAGYAGYAFQRHMALTYADYLRRTR